MNTETFTGLMLPPEALLADQNIRFGLKKYKIADLASKIVELGGVQTPLKVEALPEPTEDGKTHRIREGHYRHAAVAMLNKDGAGLLLPCMEVEPSEGADRIKFQVSENMDRENLSPMDMAVAIKDLLDSGMAKVDVRKLFSRPGGRKGLAMQPLSNSMLNIYVSFLEFPKAIQNKIHDGTLPVGSAYELTKQPREKWETILEGAEAARLKAIDSEERLENQYLESERKAADAEIKAKADAEALANAEKVAAEAAKEAEEKLAAAADAYSAVQKAKSKEGKAKETEHFKAVEADAKAAEKKAEDARKEALKLQEKADKNKKLAEERAAKLKEARESAAKKPGSVRPEDIKKEGAKQAGGPVPLNATDMRRVAADLSLPGSYPKVRKIGVALGKCFRGETTDQQLLGELAWICGERKEKPKTWKEATAATTTAA